MKPKEHPPESADLQVQKDRKAQTKEWLNTIEQDREWLGQKLHVGKRTVDNWLSTAAPIPERKWEAIVQLMATTTKDLPLILRPFTIYPTREQFQHWDRISRTGLHPTESLEEWIMNGLERLAAEAYPDLTTLPETTAPATPRASGKQP